MFQIEPILWLQSLASPALDWLLRAVSQLGYTPVYIALGIILTFGVRLRPGLTLGTALLLCGILTDGLKNGLALPRPDDVDARLLQPLDSTDPAPAEVAGARRFWAWLPAEAIARGRARSTGSYGFTSGHVGAATAFTLGAALFFRSRLVLMFAGLWIPLMALSRMYLGRHFLADVLGGVAVGAVAVAAAALLLRRIDPGADTRPGPAALMPLGAVGLGLAALVPFLPALDAENVGRLLGLLAAWSFVLATGLPSDRGTASRRAARVVTAVLLYLAVGLALGGVFEATGWEDARLGKLVSAALLTAATLAGTVAAGRRARWYAKA